MERHARAEVEGRGARTHLPGYTHTGWRALRRSPAVDFGLLIPPVANTWKVVRRAEELGFARVWFYDTQDAQHRGVRGDDSRGAAHEPPPAGHRGRIWDMHAAWQEAGRDATSSMRRPPFLDVCCGLARRTTVHV